MKFRHRANEKRLKPRNQLNADLYFGSQINGASPPGISHCRSVVSSRARVATRIFSVLSSSVDTLDTTYIEDDTTFPVFYNRQDVTFRRWHLAEDFTFVMA